MKKELLIIVLILIAQFSFGQQFTDLYGDYLVQTTSENIPVVYIPEIISKNSLKPSTGFSPKIVFSTYLGGSDIDLPEWLHSFSVDKSGMISFAISTTSIDFPVTDNAYDKTYNGGWGNDLAIVQFNIEQNKLKYASYFGGDGPEVASQVLSKDNKLYIVGNTGSSNFPVSKSGYERTFNGPIFNHADGFISQFDSTQLDYSTYIGTSGNYEFVSNILVNVHGEMIIAGTLKDWDKIPIDYDFSNENLNVIPNAYLIRFNAKGDTMLSVIRLGPAWMDNIAIQTDNEGYIYLAGITPSKEFPITPMAFDTSYNGGAESLYNGNTQNYFGDAFITKLSPSGDKIIFSTFLGGSANERNVRMCLDRSKSIIVSGLTYSKDFPITDNAFDKSFDGTLEPFIAKLSNDGKQLLYSSFLGGNEKTINGEFHGNTVVSENGDIYICNSTDAIDFPTTPDAPFFKNQGGKDIVLSVFDSTLTKLKFSTYIGGSGDDGAFGNAIIELDKYGNVIILASTKSSDFPVTAGAYDTTLNGSFDAILLKIDMYKSNPIDDKKIKPTKR
jgi:hypothetical protein